MNVDTFGLGQLPHPPRFSLVLVPGAVSEGPHSTMVMAREQAQCAEAVGFGGVYLGHRPLPVGFQGHPIPLLGYLASGITNPSFLIGTAVLLAASAPATEVANAAVSLAAIRDGFVDLGLGVGYRRLELEALGVPFESRVKIGRERAILIHKSLAKIDGGSSGVDVLLGADGDKNVAWAARHLHGVILSPRQSRESLQRQLGIVGNRHPITGRRRAVTYPRVVVRRDVIIGERDRDARRRFEAFALPRLREHSEHGLDNERSRDGDSLIVGTPGHVAESLRSLSDSLGGSIEFALRLGWPGMSGLELLEATRLGGEVIARACE